MNRPRLEGQDLFVQAVLTGLLFFILTGAGLLIGWEDLKRCRDLYRFWVFAAPWTALGLAYWRYLKDRSSFFELEPVRSLKAFVELPPWISVSAVVILHFATLLARQLVTHGGLETSLWDMGFFDQILWNTAHGDFLITSVRGGLHIFCEHFKPILFLIAGIYKVCSSLSVLLAATDLVTASSLAAVYLIARDVTKSHATGLVFLFCASVYPPFLNGVNFLYHTQMLSDPFLLWGWYFLLKGKSKTAFLFLGLALLCKENTALDVLGIGLFAVFQRRKGGWGIVALAILCLGLWTAVLEPHYRNPNHFYYQGGTRGSVYQHFLHPGNLENWKKLWSPNPLWFLWLVFGPFLLLPFSCPGWPMLLGPSLFLRLFIAMPGLRLTTAHYTGGLDALVFIAAIEGFKNWAQPGKAPRAEGWREFFRTPQVLSLLLLAGTLSFVRAPQLLSVDQYLRDLDKPENQRAVRVLDSIPSGYSVLSSDRTSAHLAHRKRLYVFFEMFAHTPYELDAAHPDLIVWDGERTNPRESLEVQRFQNEGYREIWSRDFLKIYARPGLEVPEALVRSWHESAERPALPYRASVRKVYMAVFLLSLPFLFFCFYHRSTAIQNRSASTSLD